jgi:hypothetical protein
MTPEMIGRQENTNQKRRMEMALDLINARVSLSGQQRNQIREIIREKFSAAIEEEREACAEIVHMVKEELSQRPEKLQYGRTQIEVAEYIETEIRARSL